MPIPILRALATGALLLTLSACVAPPPPPIASVPVLSAGTVGDTLISDGRFNTFVALVQRSGLMDSLRTAGAVTLFAPTDAAFNQLPATIMQDLAPQNTQQMPSPAKLQAFVRINELPSAWPPPQFLGRRQEVQTMAGTYLIVDGTQNGGIAVTTVTVNVGGPNIAGVTTPRTARALSPAIGASNGIIYPVDNVLLQ